MMTFAAEILDAYLAGELGFTADDVIAAIATLVITKEQNAI